MEMSLVLPHATWIFADPLQTSDACHRFQNCYFRRGRESIVPTTKKTVERNKWSEVCVFLKFRLRSVLLATAAWTFWIAIAQLLKVLWAWSASYFLTAKCALRRSRVQFLISQPTRWLRTLSEPTFRGPPSPETLEKNTVFCATFLPFCALEDLLSADSLTLSVISTVAASVSRKFDTSSDSLWIKAHNGMLRLPISAETSRREVT